MRDIRTGEVLIQAGREVRELFFVVAGELDVVVDRVGLVARLAQGDVAGESSFVERRLPVASVIAAGPGQVLAVPRGAVDDHIARDHAFAARFYRALAVFLSDRLRTATSGAPTGSVEELDDELLDSLHVAGDRFNRLLDLLTGREH